MAHLNKIVRSLLLTLFVTSAYGSTIPKQTITFYEKLNCTGKNFTFEESNFDLFQHWVTNSTSYYMAGMWEVQMQVINSFNPTITKLEFNHSIGSCYNTYPETKVVRIERYGPSLLVAPEITLFSDRRQRGIRIPACKPGLSFTRPIMTQSFMFTGVHEWTIFEDINFEGSSLCLRATDEVKEVGYGITYDWEKNIPMGSIKYGCSTGSNSETSTRSNIMVISILSLTLSSLIMKI